jgi:hypothetical protein
MGNLHSSQTPPLEEAAFVVLRDRLLMTADYLMNLGLHVYRHLGRAFLYLILKAVFADAVMTLYIFWKTNVETLYAGIVY